MHELQRNHLPSLIPLTAAAPPLSPPPLKHGHENDYNYDYDYEYDDYSYYDDAAN